MKKTNEQIINEFEEAFAELSPEEQEAALALESATDKFVMLVLKKRYGCEIELIPGDRHHIKIDGEVMGYVEFSAWLLRKESEKILEEYNELEDEDSDDEDDEDSEA